MAKEPEDNTGSSHPGGDESPEKSPLPEDLTLDSEGQEELPFDEKNQIKGPDVDFPEAKFPQPDEVEKRHADEPASGTDHSDETLEEEASVAEVKEEVSHKDEHSDGEIVEPNIAGELEEGDEKSSGEEHDHGHDEYHHDYHDEYHEEHYHKDEHDYHGHEDDHGDYGQSSYDGGGFDRGNVDDSGGEDDGDEDEVFGGPIKPFFDHLEDLRWMLVKCVVAILLGLLIALMGAGYVVDALLSPLEKAQTYEQSMVAGNPAKRTIPIRFGNAVIKQIRQSDLNEMADSGQIWGVATNTTQVTALKLEPYPVESDQNGTQYILRLMVDLNGTGKKWDQDPKTYDPMEPFKIALRIAFYGGISVSMPFVLLFVFQFVLPALRVREKGWLFKLSGIGSFLFLSGALFAYKIVIPIALWAAVGFSGMLGFTSDAWRAGDYISFVCVTMLIMGIAFQLPMVLLLLVKIGILDYKKLANFRMYAVVINLVLSAVLTPTGDPFTLLLVATPLHLLYELSILIAWFWHKKALAEEED